jgi:SAM-dependent methyltransferase
MNHSERGNITHVPLLRWVVLIALAPAAASRLIASDLPPKAGAENQHTKADAERMIRAAEGGLAPVYGPLAEEIADKLDLAGKEGVGIDLGSGPGTLIVELCKHTKLHWINADINPHFFPYFVGKAEAAGCGGRVSTIQADACALPFRDDYADVIVSRGSLQFWPDLQKGLSEIHRVLKPGGVAWIGRGFPERLPLEIAKTIRGGQGESMKYDPDKTEQQLREIMESLRIQDYRIVRPRLNNSEGVNYGVWLRFHKVVRSDSQ